jgi:NADH:ubiquinone oxidoreductase subunit 3 (subunit A)
MSSDVTGTDSPSSNPAGRGVRIFTYPKIIFLVPTLIAALACGIGMMVIGDRTDDPTRVMAAPAAAPSAAAPAGTATATEAATPPARPVRRFSSTQNFLAMIFLLVFGLNLLIMSLDFPRFTVVALVLFCATLGFFILWLNVYFELLPPIVAVLEQIFAVANAGFYFLIATAILVNFLVIWGTRYLDYWEVLPNEILHNHGPFSDLERYPTFQLKFDKEIPDILEYALLRSGRLVLHIPGQSRAIVLDNVLWINSKEDELKKLLGSMQVRVSPEKPGSV